MTSFFQSLKTKQLTEMVHSISKNEVYNPYAYLNDWDQQAVPTKKAGSPRAFKTPPTSMVLTSFI